MKSRELKTYNFYISPIDKDDINIKELKTQAIKHDKQWTIHAEDEATATVKLYKYLIESGTPEIQIIYWIKANKIYCEEEK